MSAQQLVHIDTLDESIARVSAEMAERVHPFEDELTLLDSVTGVGRRIAEALVAEAGVDLTRDALRDGGSSDRVGGAGAGQQ